MVSKICLKTSVLQMFGPGFGLIFLFFIHMKLKLAHGLSSLWIQMNEGEVYFLAIASKNCGALKQIYEVCTVCGLC